MQHCENKMTNTHSESGAAGRIRDWVMYSWELPAALCVLAVDLQSEYPDLWARYKE